MIDDGYLLRGIQGSEESARGSKRITRHFKRHPNLFIREPSGALRPDRRDGRLEVRQGFNRVCITRLNRFGSGRLGDNVLKGGGRGFDNLPRCGDEGRNCGSGW